jgi:NAD+ kinase
MEAGDMSRQFNKIGIIGKHGDPNRGGTLPDLLAYFGKHKTEILLDKKSLGSAVKDKESYTFVDRKTMGENCDLIIVVGGDGTLLNAARDLVDYQVSLLGINLGRLGFLADVTPSELEETLDQICSGNYKEDQRALLHAQVIRGDEQINDNTAFNDVVLHTRNVARMIEYETYINGQFVNVTRSDGLIVSTPTGSTAYALSGGGPILHPDLNALVLVPICPHTMSHRPIVVDADSKIEIVVSESNQVHAQCTCDGQIDLALQNGDHIVIEKKEHPVCLIHPENYNYFKLLRAKLHWGKRL